MPACHDAASAVSKIETLNKKKEKRGFDSQQPTIIRREVKREGNVFEWLLAREVSSFYFHFLLSGWMRKGRVTHSLFIDEGKASCNDCIVYTTVVVRTFH